MEGTYKVDVAVHKRDGVPYDYHRLLYTFRIKSRARDVGIYRPRHRWTFSPGVHFKTTETGRLVRPGSGHLIDFRATRTWVPLAYWRPRSPASRVCYTESFGSADSVTTSTSLNLRALLKTAIARSGMDIPARVVSGLTPAAKALFVAAAASSLPHGVVLYVLPSDADIEQAVEDVAFFVAAMEGLSGAAADRAILPFPSHEVDPYRGLAPHVGVTSVRARALHGIGAGTARVVVASASALMPRISAPRRLLGAALDLKPGQEIAPIDLAELLDRRRLHPRGSGRRARRVRGPRRHRRHFSGGRVAAGPARVRRRHD